MNPVPFSVVPVKSDHGDVRQIIISRTDGKSLDLQQYAAIFASVVGRHLTDVECSLMVDSFFSEEVQDA